MILDANSIFPIVIFDKDTDWVHLLDVATPHLEERGLSRLKAALSANTKTVVVERHYIDKDYRDTFSQFHSQRFSTPDSRCIRLHFFAEVLNREDLKDECKIQPHYLGYSILRPTRPNSIGRTFLTAHSRPNVNGSITVCREKVSIQGTELTVKGFPFISQDADATVCAQSALWMLIRYFSNRFPVYPEMYPVQIGNLTRDYSIGRLLPSSGLRVWQMAEALRQSSFAPVLYDRDKVSPAVDFDHLLYTYIESGVPVLATFQEHVIVLFGHYSDFSDVRKSKPYKEKSYIMSSSYNRAFIGNDDNGIPYQVLRAIPLREKWEEVADGKCDIKDISQFIAPLPAKVFLPAESFQSVVETILDGKVNDIPGYQDSAKLKSQPLILRLLLTTGRSFKKNLAKRGMGSSTAQACYRNLPLPHFIWLCELSQPDIYPNSVLGEIVWDATRNAFEPDGWIAVHYPETLIVDQGSALNQMQDLQKFSELDGTTYPIYRSNLEDFHDNDN